jgi:hypothetical protein
MSQTGLSTHLGDIMATRGLLTITLFSAFFIGFVYMIIMRLFGGPLIYLSIMFIIIGTLIGATMLKTTGNNLPDTD